MTDYCRVIDSLWSRKWLQWKTINQQHLVKKNKRLSRRKNKSAVICQHQIHNALVICKLPESSLEYFINFFVMILYNGSQIFNMTLPFMENIFLMMGWSPNHSNGQILQQKVSGNNIGLLWLTKQQYQNHSVDKESSAQEDSWTGNVIKKETRNWKSIPSPTSQKKRVLKWIIMRKYILLDYQ